jgi:hypothetical protein
MASRQSLTWHRLLCIFERFHTPFQNASNAQQPGAIPFYPWAEGAVFEMADGLNTQERLFKTHIHGNASTEI